jgi:hypothetical protein
MENNVCFCGHVENVHILVLKSYYAGSGSGGVINCKNCGHDEEFIHEFKADNLRFLEKLSNEV